MWLLFLFLTVATATVERWTLPSHLEDSVDMHGLRVIARVAGYTVVERKKQRGDDATPISPLFAPTVPRRQHTRYYRNGVTDPLYASQWHLGAVGVSGEAGNSDHWSSYHGRNITIAIVDDGLEWNHPDLRSNYIPELSHNFNGGNSESNPNPSRSDGHGTSAAGVCCAARNNICGRGVAYEASLVGIRLIAEGVYDYEEALGLTHRTDRIRIYSCSWGPADDGRDMVAPGPVLQAALRQHYEDTIYVWAGGNGRDSMDSSNYDGYANSPYVLAIGALDHLNQQAYYSESGANLMAVTPSSGSGRGITTTDLTGADGYSSGECTAAFGGTSSAAPLAAGIIALMLQARPELKTRDVQHLIAKYATKEGLRGGSWSVSNVRGYSHSNEFGFGLLKIPPLIEAARTWQLVGPLQRLKSSTIQVDRSIPTTVRIPAPSQGLPFIERVLVTIAMTHSRRGQVTVLLRSRYATSVLATHRGDVHSGASTWTYSTLRHWGEEMRGGEEWIVEVGDDTPDGYTGTVQSVAIEWMGKE